MLIHMKYPRCYLPKAVMNAWMYIHRWKIAEDAQLLERDKIALRYHMLMVLDAVVDSVRSSAVRKVTHLVSPTLDASTKVDSAVGDSGTDHEYLLSRQCFATALNGLECSKKSKIRLGSHGHNKGLRHRSS